MVIILRHMIIAWFNRLGLHMFLCSKYITWATTTYLLSESELVFSNLPCFCLSIASNGSTAYFSFCKFLWSIALTAFFSFWMLLIVIGKTVGCDLRGCRPISLTSWGAYPDWSLTSLSINLIYWERRGGLLDLSRAGSWSSWANHYSIKGSLSFGINDVSKGFAITFNYLSFFSSKIHSLSFFIL